MVLVAERHYVNMEQSWKGQLGLRVWDWRQAKLLPICSNPAQMHSSELAQEQPVMATVQPEVRFIQRIHALISF